MEAVLRVESVLKESDSSRLNQQLCSPLLDSITLENLQSINDKCDTISKNLLELDSNISEFHKNFDSGEQTTQFLRNRFMMLIDVDEERQEPLTLEPQDRRNEFTSTLNQHKNLHLLGSSVQSASFNSHFHLSPIDIHVTSDNIIDYIVDNARIKKANKRST